MRESGAPASLPFAPCSLFADGLAFGAASFARRTLFRTVRRLLVLPDERSNVSPLEGLGWSLLFFTTDRNRFLC